MFNMGKIIIPEGMDLLEALNNENIFVIIVELLWIEKKIQKVDVIF